MTFLIIHGIGGYAGIHWQQWLSNNLTKNGHTVIMPTLPNSEHPIREVWLEEIKKSVKDTQLSELIIVGHSLGVTNALDFLEQVSQPIKAFVSVSGFATDYGAELNSYFLKLKDIDFNKVRHAISQAYVLYGDNDPYVTQQALAEVAVELGVDPTIINKGGHLNTEAGFAEFPKLLEILETIQ
jgi:predicted alpha/beta hydrolase family esterase